jgi:hypothetical protein
MEIFALKTYKWFNRTNLHIGMINIRQRWASAVQTGVSGKGDTLIVRNEIKNLYIYICVCVCVCVLVCGSVCMFVYVCVL